MGTGGFTDAGLAALDAALARHTSAGAVPGLVALVARDGEVHVTSAGHKAVGDGAPIGRDAIFRIASLTKPVTGVAAMLLIEDGAMALDDPVERWLPELSARRVLRSYDAELSDTVPAKRPITVEDVLSFRLGFGNIFTPRPLPVVQAAEGELKLKTLGPPWPPTPHNPDQWIAAFGSLPLLDQPGERFGTTQARRSPASSSNGSQGPRSLRCSASGCSSRTRPPRPPACSAPTGTRPARTGPARANLC